MFPLRFPSSFPQLSIPSPYNGPSRSFSFSTSSFVCSFAAAAAVTGAGVAAGIAISKNPTGPFPQNPIDFLLSKFPLNNRPSSPFWGSLSLADNASPVTESKSGVSFPAVLGDSQRLLGVGLRRKAVFGLKNIDVYAFGVYANDVDVNKFLSEKYGAVSSDPELKGELRKDLMEADISMTVRLQIVYGRLSIRSVRNAFEESVGSRLQKFGGSENKELLQRFTSQFKDEYKIPRGSIIDLSREPGYVIRTTIDGKDVGSIQSKLLCQSILDLYIGEDPFDQKAKQDIDLNLASLLHK